MMTHEERVSKLHGFLRAHNLFNNDLLKIDDFIFDQQGIITAISTSEQLGYFVEITPLKNDGNFGAGYGNKIQINF